MRWHNVLQFLAALGLTLGFTPLLAQSESEPLAPVFPITEAQMEADGTIAQVDAQDGAEPASSADRDAELEAFVDGLIATWQAVHGAPGYTVAVVRPDRTMFAKGYGLADVEAGTAVDPAATRFHVASISKTFIWTAVMMLVERGVLDLDEDVNTYLQRYTVPDGDRVVTLRDLMSHRAGLEENLDLFSTQVAALERAAAIATTEPRQVFPRGVRAAYSNWGSNLTALVIEDATGRDYAELLSTEILDPLGMTATTLTDASPAASDPATPVAKNYRVGASGPEELGQLDLGSFAPIGGMATTAEDMARWMRFHLNRGELDGVRLLSDAGYAELRRRDFDPVAGAPGRARGFADTPYRSVSWYGHTGSINAFYSKFAVSPELGLGVFIAQNTTDDFDPLDRVPAMVFDRELAQRGQLTARDHFPLPSQDDIEAAENVAGNYLSSRRVFSGPLKVLAALDGPIGVRAEDGMLMVGQSNAPFVRIGPDLWENRLGERLAFVRGGDGSISHMITPGGASDAVPLTWRTNPTVLGVSLGATILFSLTTWLGLWRRFRQQPERRRTGKVLSVIALLATLPIAGLGVLAANMPDSENLDFAAVFSDWPLPFLSHMSLLATVVAASGAILLVCLLAVWTRSGWNLPRRIHFTLYTLAYSALGLSFANWGLVPLPG